MPVLTHALRRFWRDRIGPLALLLILWLGLAGPRAWAQMPPAPEMAARAYLLLDVTANQVLASREADLSIEPASLTKLMTAYLVFDALRNRQIELKQTLTVSERAARMTGSRMFISAGQQVAVEDLLKGMIVQSGNDASVALAEGVAGSAERFVQLMNEQARALGMQQTQYKNPEGQSEAGHRSTARDLSRLATRLMRDFPESMAYFAIKKYRLPGTPAANENNRNLLLFRDPTVDGLIAGHTDSVGFCLVSTARRQFPNVGARRLLAIVLGADSENARASESQKLLNWGFTAFDPVKLFDAGQNVATPPIWKGKSNTVRLGSFEPLVVAVPAGSAGQIRTLLVRPDPLVAPLIKGQGVGTLKVLRADEPLLEVPVRVLETVEEAGVLGRAWDAIRLWIR